MLRCNDPSKSLAPDDAIAAPWAGPAEVRRAGICGVGVFTVRRGRRCKMARILFAGVVVLVLMAGSGRAQGITATPKNILDLLYPQAAGWTLLSTFPHPSPHLLDDPIQVETLGYFDRLQTGADRCSPMLRMFLGRGALDRFRSANLLGPGDDNLVYAGQKPCAEGDWTIVWRHGLAKTGSVSVITLDAEIQRVLTGPQPKAVGVAAGCRGDPWSYYCLYDPIPHETCTAVPGALIIPHGARAGRSDITLRQEVKLFPSPDATFEQDYPYHSPVRTAGTKVGSSN
jgi:hypothetical protein